MNNSGNGELQVPGFGNIPINYESKVGQIFAHGALPASEPNYQLGNRAARLTMPELFMLRLMQRVMEVSNWEHDVLNDKVVAQWYEDALSDSKERDLSNPEAYGDMDVDMDLVSKSTWDWCIAELRDKAIDFRKDHFSPTLNADSGVCVSDALVGAPLQNELQQAFQEHLNSNHEGTFVEKEESNWMHDMVDPSLFSLVFGRTPVLNQGQVSFTNDGPAYPTDKSKTSIARTPKHPSEAFIANRQRLYAGVTRPLDYYRWSNRFQWLPSEVEFIEQEASSTKVGITSYINNLHPKNQLAYAAIEKLISLSLEPWNRVLIKQNTSRYPLRIKTFGFEPCNLNDRFEPMDPKHCQKIMSGDEWAKETWDPYFAKVQEYLALPEPGQKYEIMEDHPEKYRDRNNIFGSLTPSMSKRSSTESLAELINLKWERLHTFKYPEAGVSYSYENWQNGKTAKPIIEKRERRDEVPNSDMLSGNHSYQRVCLQDEFREKGLQVIIRASSLQLTPEVSSYPGDSDFHVDGFLNEHIVATSRYYYDVDNIESRIAFQQECTMFEPDYVMESDAIHKIFGIPYTIDTLDYYNFGRPKALQTLGSVPIKQGTFLAWSNTLRYKTQPVSLKDKSRPGHQRFVVVYLVDPHYRICSTRNVPSQQHDWWHRASLGIETPMSRKLPTELADLIMSETGDWPMGLSEAEKHKKESEEERDLAVKVQSERVGYHDFEAPLFNGD